MKVLTKKQKEILDFILNNKRILSPTFKQMRIGLNVKSNQTIIDRLKVLQCMGYLDDRYLPNPKLDLLNKNYDTNN